MPRPSIGFSVGLRAAKFPALSGDGRLPKDFSPRLFVRVSAWILLAGSVKSAQTSRDRPSRRYLQVG
jgi:hypothetical protein